MKNERYIAKRIILFILLFLVGCLYEINSAFCATYYVNLNASSYGNGTINNPWNNLNSARKSQGPVTDGDTIFIWGTSTGTTVTFTSSDSGSSGSVITYIKRTGYTAILDGNNSTGNCIAFFNGVEYLVFDGLEILGYTNSGFSFTAATTTNCNYITIQNCYVHDMLGYAAVHSGEGDVHNLSILNNTITRMGNSVCDHGLYFSEGENILVRGNSISFCSGNGIQVQTRSADGRTVDGLIIDRNDFFDNGHTSPSPGPAGNGIYIADHSSAGNTITNVLISNNRCWDNEDAGINFRDQNSVTNKILNNTFYSNGEWGIEFSGTPEPIVRNNIVYGNNGSWGNHEISHTTYGTQSNNCISNPAFVSTNDTSSDFLKIASGSSGIIDQGYDVSAYITVDYWGTPRDANIDIGAHEYGSSQQSNQTPNGTINSPSGNLTINVGDTVTFNGSGNDPDNDVPLTYLWQFGTGSGVANSTLEDPGQVQFNNPGIFNITLTVTDAQGLSDTSPATIAVTVQNIQNLEPNGIIDNPLNGFTIDVGNTINFNASGNDPDNDLPLTYLWNFGSGSGIANSTLEDPGQIQFNNPGTFNVTLTVTDAQGLSDTSPATCTVTVQNTGSTPPPSGNIITVTPSDNYTKIQAAQAGDIVEIAPGTYRFKVYLTNNGTQSNPIIIRAQDPNNRPVWDLSGNITRNWPGSYTAGDNHRGIWQVTGNWIEINGIEFKNGHDDSNCAGIRPKGPDNLTIKNCHFEGNDNGITGWGTVLVENSTFYANGDPGPGDMTHNIYTEGGYYTFRYCHIWEPLEGQNIHSRSLNMDIEYCIIENAANYMGDIMDYRLGGTSGQTFTQTLTLKGNLIIQNTAPSNDAQVFVMFYDGGSGNTIDMRINMYYNTFIGYNDNAALIHITNSNINHQSAYLYNNIFYGNHRPFRLDISSNFHVESNNNWWPSGYDYSSSAQYMSNPIFGTDPAFTNPGQKDYSLTSSSQLIDKALTGLGEIPSYEPYFNGSVLNYRTRSEANDLGVFECITGGQLPDIPTNISVTFE